MAIDVNPPPQVRIPREFLQSKEVRVFFEQQQQILFQLWNRTGGSQDVVDQNQEQVITALGAMLKELQDQIGSGEPLTADTTSWTVDSTIFWADETEA